MTDSTAPKDTGEMLILSPEVVKRPSLAKELAYGAGSGTSAVGSDNAYRSERGQPFLRAGTLVVATPQFKGLTLYSPNQGTQQIVTTVPVNSSTATTVGPTTASATYVVIPEMKVSVSTSGGRVYVIFSASVLSNNNGGGSTATFGIFRDAVQVGTDFFTAFPTANANQLVGFNFLDNPIAGTHTYDIRWKNTGAGLNTLTATGTTRFLQALELQVGSSPSIATSIPTKAR